MTPLDSSRVSRELTVARATPARRASSITPIRGCVAIRFSSVRSSASMEHLLAKQYA